MADEKAAAVTLMVACIPLVILPDALSVTTPERMDAQIQNASRIYSNLDADIVTEEIVIAPFGIYFVIIATCHE